MTAPSPPTPPPAEAEIRRLLGSRFALWKMVVATAPEFGARWRWAFSEATGAWSYRAYLPGERFFVALAHAGDHPEVSFNLKAEEWAWVPPGPPSEEARLDALREKALASGDEPAWVHVEIAGEADLPLLSKLLFARGKRVQPQRRKPKPKRR